MKLDLKNIKDQINEYHIQVSEIISGIDAELEQQKRQCNKILKIEVELLKIMDRLEKIEKKLSDNI